MPSASPNLGCGAVPGQALVFTAIGQVEHLAVIMALANGSLGAHHHGAYAVRNTLSIALG